MRPRAPLPGKTDGHGGGRIDPMNRIRNVAPHEVVCYDDDPKNGDHLDCGG